MRVNINPCTAHPDVLRYFVPRATSGKICPTITSATDGNTAAAAQLGAGLRLTLKFWRAHELLSLGAGSVLGDDIIDVLTARVACNGNTRHGARGNCSREVELVPPDSGVNTAQNSPLFQQGKVSLFLWAKEEFTHL